MNLSESVLAVGLMSGTSGDGIDAAVVRVAPEPTLVDLSAAAYVSRPYTTAQRALLFELFDHTRATADRLCEANFIVGEWFAAAARDAVRSAGSALSAVDLIGSHGQTVYHIPPGTQGRCPSTLQIGEPAVIAERTGITTVGHFRPRDMAAGGHGAPLVSYLDALLFTHDTETRAVLNIGGIANVTVLPPRRSGQAPVAFDTGPGNMVIDYVVTTITGGALTYDMDGRLATAGQVDTSLLESWLAEPYFAQVPPKTTGRDRFGAPYAAQLLADGRARGLLDADVVATVTALTAVSVARALRTGEWRDARGERPAAAAPSPVASRRTLDELIVGGGGSRNPTLLCYLREQLPETRLVAHEAYGLSSGAKEALCFAVLAAQCVRGLPNTVPSCTGARHPVVTGTIVPGRNYAALMKKLFG